MSISFRNWTLMILMALASATAYYVRPTILLADQRAAMDLEKLIPKQFAGWRELEQSNQIVNPQQTELLKKLYAQTISRTYINNAGNSIMLSIAYGENQSRGLALHYPDVCYPAQGFTVTATSSGVLPTAHGDIRVQHLNTEFGKRKEPLTYWSTIGNTVVTGSTERRLALMRYAFRGQIPDGLIFRVSSITSDTKMAYDLQQQFVSDLLDAMSSDQRQFLSGLL